jgi:hypothetical protein
VIAALELAKEMLTVYRIIGQTSSSFERKSPVGDLQAILKAKGKVNPNF